MTAGTALAKVTQAGKRVKVPADGATVACLYVLVLLLVPARLIISRIPMTLAPITALAAVIGVLWACAQLTNSLWMAKGRNLVRGVLLVLLVTQLITYAVATRRFLPEDELNLADAAMIRIVGTIAIAVFIIDAIRTRDRLDRMLKFLVGVTAVMAGIGILQFALGVDITQYMNLPGLRAQTAYDAIQDRAAFRRPSGTTNHPIEFGLICASITPLAGHYLFQAKDNGTPMGRWWLALGAVGGGALLSVSRTAIVGLAIAGIALIIALPGKRKIVVLVMGAASIGFAGLLVPGLLNTLYGLFANFGNDPSITHRTNDYDEAWRQVSLNPWLGRGFGTYLPSKYQLLDNQYLLTLIENGWIGCLAMIAVFLGAIIAAAKVRYRAKDLPTQSLAASLIAGVSVGTIGAATFDLFSFGVATGVLFVLIGSCGALLRTTGKPARMTATDQVVTADPNGRK